MTMLALVVAGGERLCAVLEPRARWRSRIPVEEHPMGRVVIACYRPKPGQHAALLALMRSHVATLRSLDLVTARAPIAMQARDGTIVEVFEWASPQAIEAAHSHPDVLKMWEAYNAVCDYIPVAQVPEAAQLFAEFTPVEVPA
jgi:hypothetical protein